MTNPAARFLSLGALGLFSVAMWSVACGGDEPSSLQCVGEVCDLACDTPDCTASCTQGADCNLDCTGAACDLTCGSASTCNADCRLDGGCNT